MGKYFSENKNTRSDPYEYSVCGVPTRDLYCVSPLLYGLSYLDIVNTPVHLNTSLNYITVKIAYRNFERSVETLI